MVSNEHHPSFSVNIDEPGIVAFIQNDMLSILLIKLK